MPTQTYLNLSKEKQEKIIMAALKEFSSVPFEKVSINRIIKDAEISRGSFYMYFEDIYDLLQYMLDEARIQLMSDLKKKDIQDPQLLENIILAYHDVVFDYYNNETYRNFFRNVFVYFQGRPEDEIQSMKGKFHPSNEFSMLSNLLDKNQFRHTEKEYIDQIIELSLVMFRNTMIKTFMLDLNKQQSSDLLKESLEIMKNGYGRK